METYLLQISGFAVFGNISTRKNESLRKREKVIQPAVRWHFHQWVAGFSLQKLTHSLLRMYPRKVLDFVF